ncbi:MAG: hypothetical protein Q4E05_12010, partial [Pseudoclavibacter sp.]|nr:hypothetical protein [Pseudoclavibacter sp.]
MFQPEAADASDPSPEEAAAAVELGARGAEADGAAESVEDGTGRPGEGSDAEPSAADPDALEEPVPDDGPEPVSVPAGERGPGDEPGSDDQ